MLIEIYRDAFTFPLISKRIETETTTIKNFHEADDRFLGKVFTFDSGIPIISDRHISGPLKIYSLAMADLIEKKEDPRIGKNEVYCRFFMFELMLVWTFFHELSHILQRHYMLNFIKCSDDLNSVAIEEINDHNKNNPDINAQAREILADVEGLDLTLKYLGRTDRITYVSMYLLLCSIGCMFQRFYRCYNEDLNLADGQHPHPVIRDEASNTFCIKWIGDHLVSSGFATELKDIALPLIYSSVRASIFTGLFRAHRIEEFNGAGLPSYMTLQSEAHQIQRNDYLEKLRSAIDEQSPHIKKLHLLSEDSFESILSHL
ncbi:Uncharacterised protein [Stutzerimonas stutzeri]|nr:Uncharacterised protein [Stutzerimonas stutzeri]